MPLPRPGRSAPSPRAAAALALVALTAAACAPATGAGLYAGVLRPADNVPARFTHDSGGPTPERGVCPARINDPRDGTVLLTLERSRQDPARETALGDFSVRPAGRYGLGLGELLRVDCARLVAVGIVAR